MLKLMIDTCVWLDMAKSRKHDAVLSVLEELVRMGEVSLLVPTIIAEEFARNKDRVIKDAGRSLSGLIKDVKSLVSDFGDVENKELTLDVLNDVDYRNSNSR